MPTQSESRRYVPNPWHADDESSESAQGNLLHNVVVFARVLRRMLGVPISATGLRSRAPLQLIDLGNRAEVRDVSRAVSCAPPRGNCLFDHAFDSFWRRRDSFDGYTPRRRRDLALFVNRVPAPRKITTLFLPRDDDELRPKDENLKPQLDKSRPTPAQETLRQKDFGIFTRDEIEQAKRLMRDLPWEIGLRDTRRRSAAASEAFDGGARCGKM